VIERAVVMTPNDLLHLPPSPSPLGSRSEPVTLEEGNREHILNLRETKWVVGGPFGAAARPGMKRTTLINTMRRRGISRAMATTQGV
jgi:formate hydrogenlyase transcriptional activator